MRLALIGCLMVAGFALAPPAAWAAEPAASAGAQTPRPPLAWSQGAAVVSYDEASREHAESLARAVYRERLLRPRFGEKMARVLMGGAKADDKKKAALADAASTVRSLSAVDERTQRRLLVSLARDLRVRLLVLVRQGPEGPSARVIDAKHGRFVKLRLVPRKITKPGAPPAAPAVHFDWSQAVPLLRQLSDGPAPGPRAPSKPTSQAKPQPNSAALAASDDTSSDSLLTSPWFWGGLGAVVTVGVTILILSQTALNEPDTIEVGGRIGR